MRTPRLLPLLLAAAVALAGCGSPPTGTVALPSPPDVSSDAQPEPRVQTISYADHPDTVVDVHRPDGPASGTTVVLVHGGFWRDQYRRDLMDPLVPSLLAEGHVVANLEYRRIGGDGAWPVLLEDVAAGVDALAAVAGVDPARVVTVGHSAGGHLAVWLAARHRLPVGAPGADPLVRPCHAVAQAGVVVLAEARDQSLGEGAVDALLGGTDAGRLEAADPSAHLPLGVPVTLVHAPGDTLVPLSQSERWVDLATAAGDEATLVTAPGDHFSVIDPSHELWAAVVTAVGDAC